MADAFTLRWKLDRPYLEQDTPGEVYALLTVEPNPTVLGSAPVSPIPTHLILLVDVYHEFSHPEPMMAAMREALSPSGLCALVEFRAEDPNVPIKPEHKMTKEQIMKELPPMGLKLAKEFEKLPWQHMMFFERDEAYKEPE